MIKNFVDKETELVYKQKFSKRHPNTIQKAALRKLIMMTMQKLFKTCNFFCVSDKYFIALQNDIDKRLILMCKNRKYRRTSK
ncbi:hypothetical protein [Treponema putidum]|uniref:hypothetical protein n=1 Tax=Treponema putidum TaxID=221027 RepID=UPI003D8DC269